MNGLVGGWDSRMSQGEGCAGTARSIGGKSGGCCAKVVVGLGESPWMWDFGVNSDKDWGLSERVSRLGACMGCEEREG